MGWILQHAITAQIFSTLDHLPTFRLLQFFTYCGGPISRFAITPDSSSDNFIFGIVFYLCGVYSL